MTQNDKINEILYKFPPSKDNAKAVEQLLELFPEFKNSKFYGQTDDKIPHLVFADFDRFLREKIKEKQNSNKLLKRAADFISSLYDSGKKDLKDLVLSGMFENLANDPLTKCLIPLLSTKAGQEFGKFFD